MSTLIPNKNPFSSRHFLNTGTGGEDIAVIIETVLESVPAVIPPQNETSPEINNSYSTEKQFMTLALRPLPLPLPEELLSITS